MPALRNKYKASTLMEVLVAMVIIMICAGMGMTALANLNKDMNGNLEIQAEIYMGKVVNNAKVSKIFTDEVFQFEGIRVEKSIKPYQKEKRLILLQVEAFNSLNKKIGEVRELILVTP